MATQNLGNVRAIIVSATAPTNTNLLWRDTSASPAVTREFDTSTSTWEALRVTSGNFVPQSDVGVANGVASLDNNAMVPAAQLPVSTVSFLGSFGSASSTTGGDLPSIGVNTGDTYICDTDGFVSTVASITFNAGDFAIYDNTNTWRQIESQPQEQADYGETNATAVSFIRNKPFTPVQEQRLRDLVYEEATASLTRSIAIFELGLTSPTTVNIAWNVVPNDDLITNIDITNLVGPFANSGNQDDSITTTTTWTLTVQRTDSEGGAASNIVRSVTSTAVVPKFFGVSDSNVYPTVDPYTDLTKLVQTSASISTREFSPTNQYVWFITTTGSAIIRDGNGFEQTDFDVTSINLVLPDGATASAWTYVTSTTKTLVNFEYELIG